MAFDCKGKMVLMRLRREVGQKYEKLMDPNALSAFIASEGPTLVFGSGLAMDEQGIWIHVRSYPRHHADGSTEVLAGAYLVPWEDVEEVFVSDQAFEAPEDHALGYERESHPGIRTF